MSTSRVAITQRIAEASPRFKARIAGVFELLEALTSGFGQVIVPGMLVVSGNAATTTANILAHGSLFRFSILAALIGVVCHIAWVFLFYELFKPVNSADPYLSTIQRAGVQHLPGVLWNLVRSDRLSHFEVDFHASNYRRAGGCGRVVLAHLSVAAAWSFSFAL